MTTLVKAMVCLALCGALTDCATLNAPSAQAYVQAAVDIAVGSAELKGITAAQINKVCKIVLAADTGVTTTLATLTQLLNAQVLKLNLPAADMLAATILEVALDAAIQAKLQGNSTVAQAQATIAEVMQYAIAASGG